MGILEIKVKMLQNQIKELINVQWTCYGPKDATWEDEYAMWAEYSQHFE
jgi:hypothetical protein